MTNVHVATDGDLLTVRVDLPALAKDLSHQVEEWKQTAERTQTQWEQSEWYLGEAKASVARLEEELQVLRKADDQLEAGHREVTARLHEAERERDVAHEGLLQGTEYLGAQLAQAQGDMEEARRVAEDRRHELSVERAQRTALEAELGALRTHGERRRALRTLRPDVTVEVQSPDGTVLFQGLPRRLEIEAATVEQAIDRLDEQWPGLRDRLCEPGPTLRRHINVYVDRERGGLDTALQAGSRVDVIAAISGG